jgi:hypothetical protein
MIECYFDGCKFHNDHHYTTWGDRQGPFCSEENCHVFVGHLECKFKGQGCGQENTCDKKGEDVVACGLLKYMLFLDENY